MSRRRLLIVGCGNVSAMHFAGYMERADRVEIVGAVDPAEDRRRYVESTSGISATFATIAEAVAAVEFDVATVCTPSSVRLEAVEQLASAGKHLFVEKPMADSLDEARSIVAAAERAGVLLAVNQNFRSHFAFGLAREVVASGEIGEVRGIEHSELTFREVAGWRAASTRHALSVMGVHWFDGFRHVLGTEATWLTATTWRSASQSTSGETDAIVHVRFGDVGVNYTQSFSSRVDRVACTVLGDLGTMVLGYDRLWVGTASDERTIDNVCGRDKPRSAYLGLEALLDAMDGGPVPMNSGADNLRTLSLMEGAYRSAESGQVVSFDEGMLR